MTIDQANALGQAEFVAEFGWVFEHSPWVAERVWEHRPFDSMEALHRAMTTAMESASPDEQFALLRAHPELGTREPMSAASVSEQAAIVGDTMPLASDMLRQYREKFGFPFIFAVKGSSPADINLALMIRLGASAEEELQQALREVRRIAWFRLQDKFKEN